MKTEQFNKGRFLSDLRGFTGTSAYYRYLAGCKLTDGSKYVAEACNAFWLMDVVASYQHLKKLQSFSGIQYWVLTVDVENNTGKVECFISNDKPVITQEIPYTDFPVEKIELYCQNKIIFLPSEN